VGADQSEEEHSGARLLAASGDVAGEVHNETDQPDWLALWGGDDLDLTPWQAYWLARCAEAIVDSVGQFIDLNDGEVVVDDIVGWCGFPAIVEPFLAGLDTDRRTRWVDTYLDEVARIPAMLRAGRVPWAETTGAEVALRAVLHDAISIAADDTFVDDDGPPTAITVAERDLDFLDELLFDDDDVLLLFDPDIAEVVIDPAGEWAIKMCALNLHPARWFIKSADGIEPVTVDLDDDTAVAAVAQRCLDRRLGTGRAQVTEIGERLPGSVTVAATMFGLRANVGLQVAFERGESGNDEADNDEADDDRVATVSVSVRVVASAGSASVGAVVVDLWSLFGFADLPDFQAAERIVGDGAAPSTGSPRLSLPVVGQRRSARWHRSQ
jgi:hypothetical protein